MEIVVLKNFGVTERAFDHRFGARLAVTLQQFLLQRTGIDTDAHRTAMVLGRLNDVLHALRVADIAGIDPQARRARDGRLDGALVVEMNVGHDGNLGGLADRLHRSRGFFVRTGNAHDIGAGFLNPANLLDSGPRVRGERIRHSLDADRRIAADSNVADVNLARLAPMNIAIGTNAHDNLSPTDITCRTGRYYTDP